MAEPATRSDHPAEPGRLLAAYFEACSSGTPEQIAACFTDDAVIYDTNTGPVRSADAAGAFWARVRDRWGGARWYVDTAVCQGRDAACEWTMTGVSGGRPFAFHGSDHYRFEGDLIAEVRQYWTFDDSRLDSGLLGYAYGDPHLAPDPPA